MTATDFLPDPDVAYKASIEEPPMTDTVTARSARDLSRDLVVLAVLADKVKDAQAAAKAALGEQLDVGDRKTALLPDGTKVGGVTHTTGRTAAAYVNDEPLFCRWVAEMFPTEVETVTRVRPAFQALVLKRATEKGAPVDGDGVIVPGVEIGDPGTSYLTVTKDQSAAALVEEAWRTGVLSPLRAIEGGDAA